MSTELCRCGHPIGIHAGTFGAQKCCVQDCRCLKFVSATSPPAGESREAHREDASSLDDDLCKRAGHVSHAEAREILHRFCNSHFNHPNSERPRITIPADPRRDDDLRMIAYIKQQSASAPPAEAGGVERALEMARSKLEFLIEHWPSVAIRSQMIPTLNEIDAALASLRGGNKLAEHEKAESAGG